MNLELKKLFTEDQKDRENWPDVKKNSTKEEIKEIKKLDRLILARDLVRRTRVLEMIENNELETGEDYYHAAMVLQHSDKLEHYKLANELSAKAMELGDVRAPWLFAASLDRYLANRGDGIQKYGTQYKRETIDSPWYLVPCDPKTTDEERAKYNVPPLKELLAREDELNKSLV